MSRQWLSLVIISAIIVLNVASPLFAAPLHHSNDGCDEADIEMDDYANQVVIKLANPSDVTTLNDILTTYNLQVANAMLADRGVYLLQVSSGDADELDDQIEDTWSAQLVYVEANYLGDIPEADPSGAWVWGGQDPSSSDTQYVNTMLELATAHQLSWGAGVTVAILDTGIQAAHPFFATQVITGYDFIDNDMSPDDIADGADTDGDGVPNEAVGHGTHVAGIVHTVAPQAKLMPLRVLDGDGAGTLFVIAEAIVYAAEQGADVISLSLGSVYRSDILEEAVEIAVEEYGVLIVAAAGNSNTTQPQYPAAFVDDAIAVTSIDENSVKATSANYGCWVDVAAPGESIFSAFPIDEYAWWSGTSMATPFVAGQAALIKSRLLNTRVMTDVATTIMATTASIEAENPTYTNTLGTGRIDIVAALNTIDATPTQVGLQESVVSAESILPPINLLIAFMLVATSIIVYQRWKLLSKR